MTALAEEDQTTWPYCNRCHHRFPELHLHHPKGSPRPGARVKHPGASLTFWLKASAFIEDVEWLLDGGESPQEVATRLGYSKLSSLSRRLHRHGRHDLAALFERRPRV